MKIKNKRRLALTAAAFLTLGSFTANGATCNCPYGAYGSGGPGGNGACNCLENQGPNGSGVCTCSSNPYYNGSNSNNPAYNTGWSGSGGPGSTSGNPMGDTSSREEDIYAKGPGSSDANHLLKEEQNAYNIFGDTYMGGIWEEKEGGGWKLKKSDGQYVSSQWAYVDGKTYLIDYDGTMLTGFRKVNGKWYYFNSVGAMQTGWLLKDGKYYFMNADGSMSVGWVNTQGLWYYFDNSTGAMLTNTRTPDGRYVNAEGILVQ